MSIEKYECYRVLSSGPEVICQLDSNLVHKPNSKGIAASCASSLARQKNNFSAFLAAHRHARPSTIFAFAKNLRFGPFSRKEKTVRMDRSFLGRLRTTLNEPTCKTVYIRFYEIISSLGIRSRSCSALLIKP